MLDFGRYRLAAVNDGFFGLDGGAMFGVVPRPLWEKQLPPDSKNRVRLALRCLLIIDTQSHRRILVDDGMGDRWDTRHAEMYALDRSLGGLDKALAAHDLGRDDITDVVLTHLHFDHAGGTARRAEGGHALAFPNATHHLQRRAWTWAQEPSEKDRGSHRPEDYDLLQHEGRLHLLEGETELFPDVDLVVSEGHTVGLQLPRIHGQLGGQDTFLTFCGDIVPTRAHLKPAWVMAYDLYPLTTIEEKKMLLAQTLEADGILFFEHDPDVAACRIGEEDGHPVVRETVAL